MPKAMVMLRWMHYVECENKENSTCEICPDHQRVSIVPSVGSVADRGS